jgi:hypothetical protein
MNKELSFLLFADQRKTIKEAINVGLNEFMVDCEWRGKSERQTGADTDTTFASFEQLQRAASLQDAEINCRINSFGTWTDGEIEIAIEAGVKRIFLPMVRTIKEVEHFLKRVGNRVQPAILIETDEAVTIASELGKLPLSRVYVGLNDLAISRGYGVIFKPLLDGTLEYLREVFWDIPFGFGGVTLLGFGHPCPVELLLAEMHRLHCDFSFLRRSFYRDSESKNVAQEIKKIHNYWQQLDNLDIQSRARYKEQLDTLIMKLLGKSHT